MNQNILVSIITPSYNQGQYIEETILSVINQTYKFIEYIIIDGGSTDNTMHIVDKYKDSINVIVSEKDKGQTDAINKGFKMAKGSIIGWINSDDILYPQCVERIVNTYAKHPDCAIIYFNNLDIINANGTLLRTVSRNINNKRYLLQNNYSINQPGSFYASDKVRQIGYLKESKFYSMDLDLWLRLLNTGDIHGIEDKPGAGFRIWESTKTQTGDEFFLNELLITLKENGGVFFSLNMVRNTYQRIILRIKKLLNKAN